MHDESTDDDIHQVTYIEDITRQREDMTFYLRVVKTIFYERAQRVSKILFLIREDKSHIFKPPGIHFIYICIFFWILNMEHGDEVIYPGAHVTCAQSLLTMVAFLLKHILSDAALTDLLNMLNLFLPNTFPQSKYKFYKDIQVDDSQVSA